MARLAHMWVLSVVALGAGCGDDDAMMIRVDGGPTDGGGVRADGGRDAGRDSSVVEDAGPTDAGARDADVDAGIEEMPPDAGMGDPDAGADPWRANAMHLRGMLGTRHDFECPAGGTTLPIWGTDVYTDDSPVCSAAVHAGLIDSATGGTVRIEILPGQDAYAGSTRFGVTSSSFGPFAGSYGFCPTECGGACANTVFDEAHCGGCGMACGAAEVCEASACVSTCAAGSTLCGGSCIPTDTDAANCGGCAIACDATAGEVCSAGTCTGFPWARSATGFRGMNGRRVGYTCPAGGPAEDIWGTDTYTDDSSVCTAAVHGGAITLAAGGTVVIEIRPGEMSYPGSMQNGITSMTYDMPWSGSFVIVP